MLSNYAIFICVPNIKFIVIIYLNRTYFCLCISEEFIFPELHVYSYVLRLLYIHNVKVIFVNWVMFKICVFLLLFLHKCTYKLFQCSYFKQE